MEIELIRHFATEGNLEKRYIGVTDEEIKAEFVLEHTLKKEENGREEWKPELVIVSPLRRCRQTAEILFPGAEQVVCEQMRECDFGLFEGKNYQELTGNPKYQSWIDSGGTKAFPGGEDPMEFRKRCVCGFEQMMEKMIKGKRKDKSNSQRLFIPQSAGASSVKAGAAAFSSPALSACSADSMTAISSLCSAMRTISGSSFR